MAFLRVALAICIFVLTVARSQPIQKASVDTDYQAQSQAKLVQRNGSTLYVTRNSAFRFLQLFNQKSSSYEMLLLRVIQRNELNPEAEGMNGSLDVEAWNLKGKQRGSALWSFRANGNEGEAYPDFGLYVAKTYPCCSAMWVNTYFSLWNGKRLYTTNGSPTFDGDTPDSGLLKVSGHTHNDERFIAFGASYEKGRQDPELQYGSNTVVKQRVLLKGHEYGDNFDVPKLSILDANGKAIRDFDGELTFTIVLNFAEDQEPAAEVRIPVENDVMQTEKATVPKGYSLISLKP